MKKAALRKRQTLLTLLTLHTHTADPLKSNGNTKIKMFCLQDLPNILGVSLSFRKSSPTSHWNIHLAIWFASTRRWDINCQRSGPVAKSLLPIALPGVSWRRRHWFWFPDSNFDTRDTSKITSCRNFPQTSLPPDAPNQCATPSYIKSLLTSYEPHGFPLWPMYDGLPDFVAWSIWVCGPQACSGNTAAWL